MRYAKTTPKRAAARCRHILRFTFQVRLREPVDDGQHFVFGDVLNEQAILGQPCEAKARWLSAAGSETVLLGRAERTPLTGCCEVAGRPLDHQSPVRGSNPLARPLRRPWRENERHPAHGRPSRSAGGSRRRHLSPHLLA